MHELALAGVTVSSLGGQTKNPYELTRTPGGSSGGTGVALAANFATVGTGSDTVNSIRSPASANSLVGIRPTRGLISRAGVIPVSFTQDAVGPITRTVADAAVMLDVMAGYDPEDPVTALGVGKIPSNLHCFSRPQWSERCAHRRVAYIVRNRPGSPGGQPRYGQCARSAEEAGRSPGGHQ